MAENQETPETPETLGSPESLGSEALKVVTALVDWIFEGQQSEEADRSTGNPGISGEFCPLCRGEGPPQDDGRPTHLDECPGGMAIALTALIIERAIQDGQLHPFKPDGIGGCTECGLTAWHPDHKI